MTGMRKGFSAAVLAVTLIVAPLAPASADWSTWTPRQGWCALVPAWCR